MSSSPETPAPPPAPEAPDLGLQLLRTIHDALEVPAEWSLEAHRNFTWWPHHLAQHVWAEPPRMSNEIEVVRVHASTDLLRRVPGSDATMERLSALNRFATLSALVWERESAEIMLHAAAYAHARNVSWLLPLLKAAVVLQAAEAHAQVEELAAQFEAEPAESSHPTSGRRRDPDDVLDVLGNVYWRVGSDRSPFTEADFDATIQMDPRPWNEAHRDGLGFSAELTLPGPGGAGQPEVHATLQASAVTHHPRLGSGLTLRLALPHIQGRSAADEAAYLNLAEFREWTNSHLFGAWCKSGEDALSFVQFLPAAVYEAALLSRLAWNLAVRGRWAASYLEPGRR
jgi:hypothetical protein